MDPVTALMIANGATATLRWLIPEIERMTKEGQITPEQQQSVLNDLNALRDLSNYKQPYDEPSGR
jgi:hypothetical protein